MDDMPAESTELLDQVEKSLVYSWDRHRKYLRWNIVIAWCTAILGLLVVAAGVYDLGPLAAVLGAALSSVIVLQKSYRPAENAYFWEQRHNEAKVFRDRLRYGHVTEEQYRRIVEDWITFRRGFMEGKPTPGAAQAEVPSRGT